MDRNIGKAPRADVAGLHHYVTTHGKKPIQTLTNANCIRAALDHLTDTPDRDFAPRIFPRREELPVSKEVTGGGVGDVVRRHGKFVDGNQYLAVTRRWNIALLNFGMSVVGSINPEFGKHGALLFR